MKEKAIAAGQMHCDPEAVVKVTGRAVYGTDLKVPGMLYAKILRSPHAHARIAGIDLSAARSMPGVRAAFSAADLQQNRLYGIAVKDERPLAADRVRYIGDEVAVVAAIDRHTADCALEAIRVDYEPLPALFDVSEALAPAAPQLHDHCPGNIAWQRELERGNSEAAFREAAVVVEASFSIPSVHPLYLEPISCLAVLDNCGGVTLHTALQSPDIVRRLLAEVLGLPISRLQISGPFMGGGFGGKVYGNLKLYILSSLLALHTGSPVMIRLTRAEEFSVGRPLIAAEIKMRMALDRDGLFLAREADIITDNGAYSAQAPWVSKTLSERNDSVYLIPNIKTRVRLVYTNKVPTGQYRAYGNQVANFAAESLIDMAALKLGLDPLQLRLKNCTRAGDTTVHGLQIKSCGLADCLQAAAASIGWNDRKKGRGYGISAAIHANGSLVFDQGLPGAAALARLELDGRVTLFCGEQDYGQGTHAAYVRIAARVLGCKKDLISVFSRHTAFTPFSLGALAMRQAAIGGRAVQMAAEDLKAKMAVTAVQMTAGEGGSRDASSGRDLPSAPEPAEIAAYYHSRTSGLSLVGEGKYIPAVSAYDQSGYGNIAATYSFAAHGAEVEIDPATGALTVHRLVAAHDSGCIIDRLSAEGQVFGGVLQGLGMGCLEGYQFNRGKLVNDTLGEYRIPTVLDQPDITAHFIETDDPEGPFGAKGLGEIVQVPVLGALANAVADAAGAHVTDLPITAEKICRVLDAAKDEGV